MKKIIAACIALFAISCASSRVHTVIDSERTFSDGDAVVIMLRIADSSIITYEEYIDEMKVWFAGSDTDKRIVLVDPEDGGMLIEYESGNERFYQISSRNKFLEYKSMGAIRTATANNRETIRTILRTHGSDYLVIYEIGGSYSVALKAVRHSSVFAIIDIYGEVLYLDYQEMYDGSTEFDKDSIRPMFINSLTERLHNSLRNVKMLEE